MPRQGVSLLNAMLGFFFFDANTPEKKPCKHLVLDTNLAKTSNNTHTLMLPVTVSPVTPGKCPGLRRRAWRKRKVLPREIGRRPRRKKRLVISPCVMLTLPTQKPARAGKGKRCRTLSRKRIITQRSEVCPPPRRVLSGRDHWPAME